MSLESCRNFGLNILNLLKLWTAEGKSKATLQVNSISSYLLLQNVFQSNLYCYSEFPTNPDILKDHQSLDRSFGWLMDADY